MEPRIQCVQTAQRMPNRRVLGSLGLLALVALIVTTMLLPDPRSAAAAGAVAIAAGAIHTCALTEADGVKCWGQNNVGQLGNVNALSESATPVDVCVPPFVPLAGPGESGEASGLMVFCPALSGVEAVAAGGSHTCAIVIGGGVQCWGRNDVGQLGAETSQTCLDIPCSSIPANVVGLSGDVTAVVTGSSHTCAIVIGGGVQCWGWNGAGQLGNGSENDSTTPVSVVDLGGEVTAIAAGFRHTCAIITGGGVQCWGKNTFGQLGNGSENDSTTPVSVVDLSGEVTAIATGSDHTCAIITGGGVQCWGANLHGRLGDGTTTSSSTPVDVCADTACTSGLSSVTFITAGGQHTCAVRAAGGVMCWGLNLSGRLGGETSQVCTDPNFPVGVPCSNIPVDVVGLGGVEAVAAGSSHTCALTTAAGVQCWGVNGSGQLGDGTIMDSSVPVDVLGVGPKATPTPSPTDTPTPPATPTDARTGTPTPPDVPTATSTPPDAPTATPTSPDVPTATPTPRATSTATEPAGVVGDANCDGRVNAIDAALGLQFGAGLIASLPCEDAADVNGDGAINAIDAALILQVVAGLLRSL